MAIKVAVPYRRTFEVPRDPQSVYDYFADFAKAVPANFPGVEEFQPLAPNRFRWVFEKVGYSSYELQIKLATQFHLEPPHRIRATPVPEPGGCQFTGSWEFQAAGQGTQITFEGTLEIELPVPSFLKSVATPLAQKELGKLFDRYTGRVEKNLA
jgi:carbon monoxide dehydrogenase subunit G